MKIVIINWNKFNQPDPRLKHRHWFRVEADMLESNDFFNASYEDVKHWLSLLSYATQRNSAVFFIDADHFCYKFRLNKKKLMKSLSVFQQKQMVTIENDSPQEIPVNPSESQGFTCIPYLPNPPNQPYRAPPDFDFEGLYAAYPRKVGRSPGIKVCKSVIKTQAQYDQLKIAIRNYSDYCKNTEEKFIKHFPTFMRSWEDWVEKPESKITYVKVTDEIF